MACCPNHFDTLEVAAGDTLSTWSIKVTDHKGRPFDLAGVTVQIKINHEDGTPILEPTEDGLTVLPGRPFVFSGDRLVDYCHEVTSNDQITLSSDGQLPEGFDATTRYFPIDVRTNDFRLTTNARPIAPGQGGSGNHSYHVVGSVEYQPRLEDVETSGYYWVWLILSQNGKTKHIPQDGRVLRYHVVEAQ
jgi:hypothetical protein